MDRRKVNRILDALKERYPDAECALLHRNAFELLVATMLSAQTTDKSVNLVTPALFEAYPDAGSMAQAKASDIEKHIKTIGLYRNKSKNLIAMAGMLCEEFGGEVPGSYDGLTRLPGVGRKTANVVLSVWFKVPRIAVDTHVFRLANRIGITHEDDVTKTEEALMKAIAKKRWTEAHHLLIFHGRNCCSARRPACGSCPIEGMCERNGI